jgi:hypothetical protein
MYGGYKIPVLKDKSSDNWFPFDYQCGSASLNQFTAEYKADNREIKTTLKCFYVQGNNNSLHVV